MQRARTRWGTTTALVAALSLLTSGCAFIARVSESQGSGATNPSTASGRSEASSVSGDGRYVAFMSTAPDLVPNDTNAVSDVFLRDRQGVTSIASVSSSGTLGSADSFRPSISTDGRYVAFDSNAGNLVTGDTNSLGDVFVRDRTSATTTRASVASNGTQADAASFFAAISGNGRYVAFQTMASNLVAGDTNALNDLFVRDTTANTTTRVSVATAGAQGNAGSYHPAISNDGRYVAFLSDATNLVTGDTNASRDVFVRDRTANTTTRVSVGAGAVQGNQGALEVDISGDGRYVAFGSSATNLIAGDTNSQEDVFVRDRTANTTSRVSIASAGTAGTNFSFAPAISDDGRYVSFVSYAPNLVAGDTNSVSDVFRRDRTANITVRMSVDNTGAQSPDQNTETTAISGDGKVVSLDSDATTFAGPDKNDDFDVFVRDTNTSKTDLVSRFQTTQANSTSDVVSLSGDGRYAVFESPATNLVPGDTNGQSDVFVRDLVTAVVERVSTDSSGGQLSAASLAPAVSYDGRYVVFETTSNIGTDTNGSSDIYVKDRTLGTLTLRTFDFMGHAAGVCYNPTISEDGNVIAFETTGSFVDPGDTNESSDVFVTPRASGGATRVSVDSGEVEGNASSVDASLSGDGRYVAFESSASNLVPNDTNASDDVFVRDRTAGTTTRVDVATNGTQASTHVVLPKISGDGRFVVFVSNATNLVTGDTSSNADVFLRDRQNNTTTRVSVSSAGAEANSYSIGPSVSHDGRYVAFESPATNLVSGDTNGKVDVFIRDTVASTTTRASTAQQLEQSTGLSGTASVSPDGRYVAFQANGTDLVTPDANGSVPDVFVRANPVPTITSATPTTVARGATVTITVNGTHFLSGVNASFGNNITITASNRASENRVTFTIKVDAAAVTGDRTVLVYVLGTGAGALTGAAAGFTLKIT